MLKHVGMITNTGRRCVVVFREIYNEAGKVVDFDNCLVVETDSLPDAIHQDLMRIIESPTAQDASELFNVLARERLGDGSIALNYLHQSGRLRKYPTAQVVLTPNANSRISLNELNTIVRMQAQGSSQAQIAAALNQLKTPEAPAAESVDESTVPDTQPEQPPVAVDGVITDEAVARSKYNNANELLAQAEQLLAEAYALDPTLKPEAKGQAED